MSDTTTIPANISLDTKNTVTMSRRDIVRGLAAGTVVAFAATGCTENPATGRSQFILVSDGQLAQLAASSWTQLKRKERISNNPAHNARLTRVGRKIANTAGLGSYNWEYVVFDNDAINAFVMPGGKVGFYSGIMNLFENDDQLAVVMGHETGHVVGRHAAERYSQSIAADVGLTASAIALEASDVQYSREIAAVLGIGVTLGVILPYSRRHELEADRLGINYMHKAGYNPRQAIPFWEKMAAKGGSRPPEFLSTHPDPTTRINAIRQQLLNLGYTGV